MPVSLRPHFKDPHPGTERLSRTYAHARSRVNGVLDVTGPGTYEKLGFAFPSTTIAQMPKIRPSIHPQQGLIQGMTDNTAAA